MLVRFRANGSETNMCKVRIVNQRNKHIVTYCDRTLLVLKLKDSCYDSTARSMFVRPW